MNQILNSYNTRKYFKRLLLSFLCISIIPLGICVFAILYANYTMSMENYTKKAEAVSQDFVIKLEEAVFEYTNITKSIAANSNLWAVLESDSMAEYQAEVLPLLQQMMTGRENRIQIHILDVDNKSFQGLEGNDSSLYDTEIYAEWGLLYELSLNKTGAVLYGNHFEDANGRPVRLNVGQAIRNQEGDLLGYVVIDVYRETLLSLLSFAEGEGTEILLLDHNGITVLDTSGQADEGRLAPDGAGNGSNAVLSLLFKQERMPRIYAPQYSEALGFTLRTYLNIEEFYLGMDLLLQIAVFLFLITVLFCLLAASLLAKRLYEPVVEETRRQKDAEIKALQAQISPHFLYNMLNEIKALAKLGRVEEIAGFVVHLGRLLRRSITFSEAFVKVRDEVEFIKDYLSLQQIRYERSFDIQLDICDEIMECRIPKLILQPLVENSIIHGFSDRNKKHVIRITGKRPKDDRLCFEIYDDGIGVDDQYISYINNVEKGSGIYGGLGVENVQKRLLLTYGMEYGLHIESEIGEYTLVRIILPYSQTI